MIEPIPALKQNVLDGSERDATFMNRRKEKVKGQALYVDTIPS
jgi:hypothetical protein